MSLSNMPMFELFPPLFKSKKIEQWTANEFWKHLKLSKKERNRFNRQRMYRLLRKLVEDGFLTKETNLVSPRFSTFSETGKIDQLREITGVSLDFIQMRHSKEETQKKISMLEKQLESFSLLEKKFPNSAIRINTEKNKCFEELTNLNAYSTALNCVLTSL
jgi:DNA-binding PadR family transcriptional regulator